MNHHRDEQTVKKEDEEGEEVRAGRLRYGSENGQTNIGRRERSPAALNEL